MNASTDPLRARIRARLNLDMYPAVLGDADGIVFEPGRPGYVRVRYTDLASDGLDQTVRQPRLPTAMLPGMPVWVGHDEELALAVLGPRLSTQLEAGINPLLNHTAAGDPSAGWLDLGLALPLRTTPTVPPSLSVAVKAWWYVQSGTAVMFPGALVDLSDYLPAAGEHRLALLTLHTDTQTVAVTASPAKAIEDPLDAADVETCVSAAPALGAPIACWRLTGDMTAITDDDLFLDLRQWLNVPSRSGDNAEDTAIYLATWW